MRGAKDSLRTPHFIYLCFAISRSSVRVFQRDDLAQRSAARRTDSLTIGPLRFEAGGATTIQQQADKRGRTIRNAQMLVDRIAELGDALGAGFPGNDQIDLLGHRIRHNCGAPGTVRQCVGGETQISSGPVGITQHEVATALHPGGGSATQSSAQISGSLQNGREKFDRSIDVGHGSKADAVARTSAIGANRHTTVDCIVEAGYVADRGKVEEPAIDAVIRRGAQTSVLLLEVHHLNIAGIGFNDIQVHAIHRPIEVGMLLRSAGDDRGTGPHLVCPPGSRSPVHVGTVGSTGGREVHIVVGQLDAIPARDGHKVDLGVGLIAAPGIDITVVLAGAGPIGVERKAGVHGGLDKHASAQGVDDPGLLSGATVRPEGDVLVIAQAGDVVAIDVQTLARSNVGDFVVSHSVDSF